jgi:hypothetical protein
MANNQQFINGYGTDGGQVTSLSNIQGKGLSIPSSDFIDIRGSGKLESLFNNDNNSEKLYTPTYIENIYNSGPISNRFDYKNPNKGQSEAKDLKWSAISDFARRDLNLVSKFLKSPSGQNHQNKQLLLQGFQSFDETKVYNPLSPRLAIARNSVFGLLDRPTRHIDTSNVISGILGGTGLGSITGAIGGLLGKAPAAPSPPRSSVASEASGGLGLSTLTSLVGGGDRSSDVMRIDGGKYDVKGLLRGKTATDAYNSYRYSRLIPQSGGGFFKNLLGGIGRFIQNNTLVGGIVPPKQPWKSNYRADEKTYDYYIGSGKIFNPDTTGISGGGILSGLLNSIGFGKKTSYSSAVQQRFGGAENISPDGQRSIIVTPNTSVPTQRTNRVGKMQYDQTTSDRIIPYETRPSQDKKYSDVIRNDEQSEIFYSDQLLNYESMVNKESYKNFSKTGFNDYTKNNFKDLFDNFAKGSRNIVGQSNEKYKFGTKSANPTGNYYGGGFVGETMWPLQFSRFESGKVGLKYLDETDFRNKNKSSDNQTQQGRQIKSEESNGFPSLNLTKNGRGIRPTNDKDHINSLGISSDLSKYKGRNALTEIYGPDIINFYFYDIVNKKYIPFNATVTGLNESNSTDWNTVEYLGRADKLYHYKGFTRTLQFEFKTVAHSIKELLPMWKRINYLLGLTRPSRYTNNLNGFIVPPMVQLTLGDFYKNHNVVIRSFNLTIPDDASWETLQESIGGDWHTGLSKSIKWEKNNGAGFAQFPKEASIRVDMYVMEKERPRTGIGNWGDGPHANDFSFSKNLSSNKHVPQDERFDDRGDLSVVGVSSNTGGGVDAFQQNDIITQPSFNPTLIDTD